MGWVKYSDIATKKYGDYFVVEFIDGKDSLPFFFCHILLSKIKKE